MNRSILACVQFVCCVLIALWPFTNARAQVLSVVPASTSLTAHPGDSNVELPVAITLANGSTPATVTAVGLPEGVTVTPAISSSTGSVKLLFSFGKHVGAGLFPKVGEALGTTQISVNASIVAATGDSYQTTGLTLSIAISNPAYLPPAAALDLPVVRINTSEVAIQDRDVDVPGTITVTSPAGTPILPGSAGADNTATFHVHGNSTALLPKLPYTVKLNTSTDLLSSMGLNCPYVNSAGAAVCDKSKSFVLLANFVDKSMMRTWAATELARAIPNGGRYLASPSGSPSPSGTATILPWSSHSVFVDVYLNGEYEGVYQLIESVKIDSHRVNIKSMSATDLSGNALTGGYLMEFNFRADETTNFSVPHAYWGISLDDPDFGQIIPEQRDYISGYVASADAALFSSNFTDPTQGWRAYFDTASLVNFYILEDLTQNWDSGRLAASAFLYKDRKNPMLYMGPAWDFDLSAGLSYDASTIWPLTPWVQVQAPWFQRLFSDSAFKSSVANQWNALKRDGILDAWIASIQQKAATMQASYDRNDKRWPMLGVPYWASTTAFESNAQETAYLVGWYKARIAYLDSMFNPNRETTTVGVGLVAGSPSASNPVTLTARVVPASATGDVVFLNNKIVLGFSTLVGGLAEFQTSLPAFSGNLEAIYVGDTTYLPGVSSETPVTIAEAKKPNTTMLLPLRDVNDLRPGTVDTFDVAVLGTTGSNVATGTISLLFNGTVTSSSTLVQGVSRFSVPTLGSGTYSVVARYSGDDVYSASDSLPLSVTLKSPAVRLDISSPNTQDAGTPFNAVITAYDAQGSIASDFVGTLHFSSTDALADLPADTTLQSGVGTFAIILRTPGKQAVQIVSSSPNLPAASTSIAVTAVKPTLHFSIADHTEGDKDFLLRATSNSPGMLSYRLLTGPATVTRTGMVHLIGAGRVVVEVWQAADGIYSGTAMQADFDIAQSTAGPCTLTAQPYSKQSSYGEHAPCSLRPGMNSSAHD